MTCINVNKEQLAGIPLNKSPRGTNGTEGLSCSEQHLWNGDQRSWREDPVLLTRHHYSWHWWAHSPPHLLGDALQQPDLSAPASFTPLLTPLSGERQHREQSWSQIHQGTAQVPPAAEHLSAGALLGAGASGSTSLEETPSLPSWTSWLPCAPEDMQGVVPLQCLNCVLGHTAPEPTGTKRAGQKILQESTLSSTLLSPFPFPAPSLQWENHSASSSLCTEKGKNHLIAPLGLPKTLRQSLNRLQNMHQYVRQCYM